MKARHEYLGCSELGAIAGLNPYRTPLEVYLAKAEPQAADAQEPSVAASVGTALEPYLAGWYERETGATLDRSHAAFDSEPLFHDGFPWLGCHPDGLDVRSRTLLECKTAGLRSRHRWGEPGSDEIPQEYLCQVAGALSILRYDRADVVALFGNEEVVMFHVKRDLDFEASLLALAAEFWDRVQKRAPPAIDGTEAATRWLARRHPRPVKTSREATPEESLLAVELRELRSQRDAIEDEIAEHENALRAAIGDSDGIAGAFGQVRWSAVAGRKSVDWDALCRARHITAKDLAPFQRQGEPSRRMTCRWSNPKEE